MIPLRIDNKRGRVTVHRVIMLGDALDNYLRKPADKTYHYVVIRQQKLKEISR